MSRKKELDCSCAWCEKPCQKNESFCGPKCEKKWLECALGLKKSHKRIFNGR